MSPESTSSIYPDRPILPLPKRRLRERLTPDVADSIKYPPAPQTTTPLFVYPYSSKDESGIINLGASYTAVNNAIAGRTLEANTPRTFTGGDNRDDTPLDQNRRPLTVRTSPEAAAHVPRPQQRNGSARHIPQAPPSTASSADGYDSFENSNNNKKRKIPTAGESTPNNNTHALSESAVFGVPSPPTTSDEGSSDSAATATAPYYQAVPGLDAHQNSRHLGNIQRHHLHSSLTLVPHAGENVGIISSAIASAEKSPRPKGQESVSLLHQRPYTIARNTPSAPTQFTFTFDSQNSVSWPGSDSAPADFPGYHHTLPRNMVGDHREAFTNRSARGVPAAGSGTPINGQGTSNQGAAGVPVGASPNCTPKKTKKRGNSLLLAARRRKQQTEDQNDQHPPKPEDIWISPTALIRQYEIKARKRRREEAERRRLLEKAKMKSRKGKKAPKAPAKNNTSTPDHATEPLSSGHPAPQIHQNGTADVQGGEYDNAHYEDDVADDDLPPLENFTRAPNSYRHSEHLPRDDDGGRPSLLPRSVHSSA
ncbi:hypothetical protein Micbo1qcDRAFT_172809 [Microdochium bolleyi]|uniref:Uncharacterized protein n=1 Tax=Microdochium bolleyi TaxID=196109 RepID=A0A136J9V1_9PEZI|nr:hypothetical protein Micbo1qcDRAFT_172809 [Microdochium bolleyi]